MKKLYIILLILLAYPSFAMCACNGTSDYDCVTCTTGETGDCRQPKDLTFAKVQATVTASVASDGSYYRDGVYLISGSANWGTSYLDIHGKHGLVIKGAGKANTVITSSVAGSGVFHLYPATNRIRIVGIGFIGSNAYAASWGIGQNFRTDHCNFTGTWTNLFYFNDGGHSTGVIDNNTIDANIGSVLLYVRDNGIGSVSTFGSPIDFGSSDWMFFEDNTVNSRNNFSELIETQYGGKIVTRHNTFTGVWGVLWEQHNTNTHSAVAVGGRAHEAYNNLLKPSVADYNAALIMRDGTGMFYNNIYDYSISGTIQGFGIYNYRAESSCATSSFTDTAAPEYGASYIARCCINTYIKGSFRGEGYPCVGTAHGVRNGAAEPVYFWDNKKTANGSTMVNISEIFTSGSSTWALTEGNEWIVSNSGKPAGLTYTAYAYPHPLTKTPSPKNIRIE